MNTTTIFFLRSLVCAVAIASTACGVEAAEDSEHADTNVAPLRLADSDTATADTTSTTETTMAARAKWCSLTTDGGQWCCSTDANGKLYCWKVPPPDVIYTFTRY